MNSVARHRSTFLYGVALAASLLLLKWLELQWIVFHPFLELYTGSVAFLFTLLGIWMALQCTKRPSLETDIAHPIPLGSTISYPTNEWAVQNLQLSKREVEVLRLMAEGLTNRQIAESLFVSVNTVKTHSSHLFEKLEVSRRTQAIDKAKKLNILP